MDTVRQPRSSWARGRPWPTRSIQRYRQEYGTPEMLVVRHGLLKLEDQLIGMPTDNIMPEFVW